MMTLSPTLVTHLMIIYHCPNNWFSDVIELGQCKVFDSPPAKDFVLTFGECIIFDDLPSDDNFIDLLLAECNIFTEEGPWS